MQAESAANLFQTDADLLKAHARAAKLARTKDLGSPITLAGKPLALVVRGDEAWVGEGGFVVRRLDLKTGKTLQLYKGHSGPVTSLGFWTPPRASPSSPPQAPLLFSGSWDKTVRVWNTKTAELVTTLSAHADFVKTLLVVPHATHPLLLTGSSDKTLKVHSLASLLPSPSSSPSTPPALQTVQTIKAHTRPVTQLVLAPPSEEAPAKIEVYSADSMGRIIVWELAGAAGDGQVELREVRRLKEHQTSVTDLVVVEDGVWTSSMDLSTTFHPCTLPPSPLPPLKLKPLPAPLALLPLPEHHLLLAGYADDTLRVFDTRAGEGAASRLVREQEGHAGEVAAVARWRRGDGEEWVVSAGLDRTLRLWKLSELLDPPAPVEPEPSAAADSEQGAASGLTAEEERELAELMGSDDDA